MAGNNSSSKQGDNLSERKCRSPRQLKKLLAGITRGISGNRLLAIFLLLSTSPALAIPPPPPEPPLLRTAKMTVRVQLIEAAHGQVSKATELCKVSGNIPVYSDDGSSALAHEWEIPGCRMSRNGKDLAVFVRGAKAISKGRVTFAIASVNVTPPDAKPLGPELCGPQPLADSSARIRVSGTPRLMAFSLNVNPVTVSNAKPAVWLDADVEIVD